MIEFAGQSVKPNKDWVETDLSHYILPFEAPNVRKKIRSTIEPAKICENAFSSSDLEWLYGFAFSKCGRVRYNNNGTILLSGNLHKCYEMFQEQILNILPGAENSPAVGGNFFITPNQYGLHNDAPRKQDYLANLNVTPEDSPLRKYVTWRNIIIPIWLAPPAVVSQIIFFKQRHIDWAHVYNHGGATPLISTTYPVAVDMHPLQFYDSFGELIPKEMNSQPYPKEDFQRNFKSNDGIELTPYSRLTGLKTESVFDWKPGSIMAFDSTQLHATNDGSGAGRGWTIKMGLLLKFLCPIDGVEN